MPARQCLAIMAVALVTAAAVGACSGSSSTHSHSGHPGDHSAQATPAAVHNADDIAFAQNMIPHHQQAVDMAAMVPTNTDNHDVNVLAVHIGSDQLAEIQTMQGLLGSWGVTAHGDHGGHTDHGGMPMEGMVDDETMSRLRSLTGPEFDVLWLRSMIGHHKGAIAMAETEIARGQNADAIKLAKIIIASQQWEIATMNHLLSVPQ